MKDLANFEAAEVHHLEDPSIGLEAFVVLDDFTLGPAAGGIRTRCYRDAGAARSEAAVLARAMTLKCALAGLPAGGGKGVVCVQEGWDREAVFERLGAFVETLGGRFRTAGDLGTTFADLQIMAGKTRWVHTDVSGLAEATGRSVLRCAEAVASRWGRSGVEGLEVLVQGCGAIGSAVAQAMVAAGARVLICDLDEARAEALELACGARRVSVSEALLRPVDILSPCALGGVITEAVARKLPARALCAGANGAVTGARADRVLKERGILHVPDLLASAGAVVAGLGRSLMGIEDTAPLIDRLGEVAAQILEASEEGGEPTLYLTRARALTRINAAGKRW